MRPITPIGGTSSSGRSCRHCSIIASTLSRSRATVAKLIVLGYCVLGRYVLGCKYVHQDPHPQAPRRGQRAGAPRCRASAGTDSSALTRLVSRGHRYVVRPPTVARASGVPQRGHAPPRPAPARSAPGWTPPLRIASRVAARSSRRSRSSSSSESARASARGGEQGPPERLVGEQVADAREHALVEQLRLDGSRPPPTRARNGVTGDVGRVGAEVGEVGVEARAAKAALVAQRHARAAGERQREAVPGVPARAAVERDPARHAEVQAEVGSSVVGLHPEGLAASVGGRELPAASAEAISPAGAGGRQRRRRRRRRRSRGPRTSSSGWRARSASGSSGMRPRLRGNQSKTSTRRRDVDAAGARCGSGCQGPCPSGRLQRQPATVQLAPRAARTPATTALVTCCASLQARLIAVAV